MKTMAGSISSDSQRGDQLGAQRGAIGQPGTPAPRLPLRRATLQGAPDGLVDADPLVAGLAVHEQRDQQCLAVLAPVGGEVVPQHDGPVALDDHLGRAADGAEPGPELVGVVHRGGEADEPDLGRRQDEHLLPYAAPVGILNEMHLIEDDRVQAGQEVRAGQQHVAQDLGRHDHHRGVGADGRVAGEQADVVLAVGGHELPVLLVGERLERGGVERLAAGAQGPVDGVGGHQGLARPGGGRDQHGVVGVDGREGSPLEAVGREREAGDEIAVLVGGGHRPGKDRQRPINFPMPMEMK